MKTLVILTLLPILLMAQTYEDEEKNEAVGMLLAIPALDHFYTGDAGTGLFHLGLNGLGAWWIVDNANNLEREHGHGELTFSIIMVSLLKVSEIWIAHNNVRDYNQELQSRFNVSLLVDRDRPRMKIALTF